MASAGGGKRGLVIDNGSRWTKAGFSKDEAPRSMAPTMVGQVKHKGVMVGTDSRACFVGDEAQKNRGLLDVTSPVSGGEVRDWKAMEQIWHHTFFNALRVSPEEQSVLVTEAPVNSLEQRRKTLELMFETFCTPSVYIGNTAVLSLYASGRTTGCVVECGHTSTHVVPVFEGYALPHSTKKMKWGGANITLHLARLLSEKGCVRVWRWWWCSCDSRRRWRWGRGVTCVVRVRVCPRCVVPPCSFSFTTAEELDTVARIKEVAGQTAMSWIAETARFDDKGAHKLEKKFALPDGTQVSLGRECVSSIAANTAAVAAVTRRPPPVACRRSPCVRVRVCVRS